MPVRASSRKAGYSNRADTGRLSAAEHRVRVPLEELRPRPLFGPRRQRDLLPVERKVRLPVVELVPQPAAHPHAMPAVDRDVAAMVRGTCLSPNSQIQDDDRDLAAAAAGRAEVIVTGDDDLLVLGEHQGTRILSPRGFLELPAASGTQ